MRSYLVGLALLLSGYAQVLVWQETFDGPSAANWVTESPPGSKNNPTPPGIPGLSYVTNQSRATTTSSSTTLIPPSWMAVATSFGGGVPNAVHPTTSPIPTRMAAPSTAASTSPPGPVATVPSSAISTSLTTAMSTAGLIRASATMETPTSGPTTTKTSAPWAKPASASRQTFT
jgi:hypothetical protein